MKVRFENDQLLADFNYRGWNPEVLVEELNEEQYNKFIELCKNEHGDLEDMNLTEAVQVLMMMAIDGDLEV